MLKTLTLMAIFLCALVMMLFYNQNGVGSPDHAEHELQLKQGGMNSDKDDFSPEYHSEDEDLAYYPPVEFHREDEDALDGEVRLLAVFDTHSKELASAVLLVNEYGAYRYKTGEHVFSGYTLVEINSDNVVLENNNDVRYRVVIEPLQGSEVLPTSIAVQEEFRPESRDEYRKRQVLAGYDLTPVSEDAPHGYIIGEKFSPEVMRQSGVRPGDIILSVNGFPVGESVSDQVALRSFQESMKAAVVISRGGQHFTFNYPDDVPGGR